MTSSPFRRLLVEPARPDRVRDHPKAAWLAVGTVCVGAFMGQLDASIVTLAIPSLRSDLHASLGAVEWVSLIYLLVLIAALAPVGRWADLAGRKLLYTYGFAVFTLASLGCGLASGLGVLLAMRVAQAFGAAMLQANSVALIRTTVREDQLNRAIGLQGAAQALGLALGPAVGGLLISWAGWRWVFFVNVPAGVFGLALGWVLLPRTRARAQRAPFDWAGLLTLIPATTLLLLGLSLLGRDGLTAAVAGFMTAAALLFAGFVLIERRTRTALIDMALFAQRAFRTGISSGLLSYLALFGVLFVSSLYLESADRMSPAAAGLLITVLPLFLGAAAPLGGAAADRFGTRTVTTAGMALVTAAFAVIAATVGNDGLLVGMLALSGVGLGLFTPANNASVAGAGRPEQAGMVSGVLNMTRGIGTSLGVAVTAATFALAPGASATGLSAGASGFRLSMVVLTVLAMLAMLLCLRRDEQPRRPWIRTRV